MASSMQIRTELAELVRNQAPAETLWPWRKLALVKAAVGRSVCVRVAVADALVTFAAKSPTFRLVSLRPVPVRAIAAPAPPST